MQVGVAPRLHFSLVNVLTRHEHRRTEPYGRSSSPFSQSPDLMSPTYCRIAGAAVTTKRDLSPPAAVRVTSEHLTTAGDRHIGAASR